jgi:N,N-dimethylformamidase beta subunit-like protein
MPTHMSTDTNKKPSDAFAIPAFGSSSPKKLFRLLGDIPRRTFLLASLAAAASFVSCGGSTMGPVSSGSSGSNPIVEENKKAGDPSWKLTRAAKNHEIEGFASATSVNRGDTISFFVNTIDSTYTLAIYRMGWYGGAGARLVSAPVTLNGIQQPNPTPAATTNLVECHWESNHQVTVGNSSDPTDWASGFYLAKLTAQTSGTQAYIVFVVRDDGRESDLLFNSSVNTYQAYNPWGGFSLYTTPRAFEVSFNRPYQTWYGSQDFLEFENNMVRFLEREGYDVTYCTDVDTHENGGNLIPAHKGFFLAGHGEYWTWQMRDNVEGARDKNVNVAFFGSNTSYWQVRYAPSSITGDNDRTIICYKYDATTLDPLALDGDPSNDHLITTQFRLPPVNRPEDQMCGAMYNEPIGAGPVNADIIVTAASSWVFQGANVQNGTHLHGLLGSEVDELFANVPAGVASIAHSPYPDLANGQTLYADMTVYTAPSGSTVFDAGTKWWNWGLDSFTPGALHPDLTNPIAQQATINILKKFGALPGTP